MLASAGCGTEHCDDIGCAPRLELRLGFAVDGQVSLGFGEYGSCDVVVSGGRVQSSRCTGAVTISSTPDQDSVFVQGTPETLVVAADGAVEGLVELRPDYQNEKPGCGKPCLVASLPLWIGKSA